MKKEWPKVALRELAKQVWRAEPVQAEKQYRTLGVRWYAEGLFLKDIKFGQEIKADRIYRIEAGDFVYNRLFAWKGSFAVAGKEAHDCYVSNEFPSFHVDEQRLDPSFLLSYFRRERAWNEALGLSVGATPTSRNRLKEIQFLGLRIPLPPLSEQRRIVARIEELAENIHEANTLRKHGCDEAAAVIDAFLSRLLLRERKKWMFKPLSEAAEVNPRRSNRQVADTTNISFVPMRAVSDATGEIVAAETRAYGEVRTGYTQFQNGDLIFARITPCMQNGKCAIAKDLLNEIGVGSTEFYVVRPTTSLEPKWLHYILRHREFLDDAAAHFTGTAGQQRVPASFMRKKLVPVAPLAEQRRIVAELDALQAEVDALKRLQAETAAELDALLPSILDKAFKGEL